MPHRPGRFASFLETSGDIGRAILAKDWSETCIGPIDSWSISLQTTIRTVLTSRQRIVFFYGEDLLQFFNEAYEPILDGMPPNPIGARFKEYWSEVFEGVRPFYEKAISGEGTWYEHLPLMLTRNGVTEETFWTFSYSPLFDDDGDISGFLNIVTETTLAERSRQSLVSAKEELEREYEKTSAALDDVRRGERRLRVLQREMSHRMKNTLAMVQAIVSQSLRHSKSIDDASTSITARITALAAAQDSLTSESWENAPIRDVIEAAILPHADGDRISFSGPDLELTAQQGLGLSLAIHELGTNAAKYGALSVPDGKVSVNWSVDGNLFQMTWLESGGPRVEPPSGRGFGSRLVERLIGAYFNGKGHLSFDPAGVIFRLTGRLGAE